MEGQSLDKEPKGSHQPSSVSELDLTIIQRNRWKETFMYGTSLKRHLLTNLNQLPFLLYSPSYFKLPEIKLFQ